MAIRHKGYSESLTAHWWTENVQWPPFNMSPHTLNPLWGFMWVFLNDIGWGHTTAIIFKLWLLFLAFCLERSKAISSRTFLQHLKRQRQNLKLGLARRGGVLRSGRLISCSSAHFLCSSMLRETEITNYVHTHECNCKKNERLQWSACVVFPVYMMCWSECLSALSCPKICLAV